MEFRQGKITQGVFDAVKICLSSGNNVAETARFMKLSKDVVTLIRDAETLMDYKAAMYAKCNKSEKKPAPEKKPEPEATNPTVIKVEATHYMMQELQKTNELLTGISAKLAQIVADLYGVKS